MTQQLVKIGILTFGGLLIASVARAETFTPVTSGPPVNDSGNSRSVSFVDVNGDGFPDLFFGNGQPSSAIDPTNDLYINNGNGTFTKVTSDTIVTTAASTDGVTWGDFDNDGDLDCYVSTWFGERNMLFINQGNGTFVRDTTSPAVADTVWSDFSAWADYDRDGKLDLAVSVGFSTPLNKQLYHNDGGGTLSRVVSAPFTTDGDRSHGMAWGDYDNDGDLDIIVTNIGQPCALYRNEGGGSFTRMSGPWDSLTGTAIRVYWADIDNDLDLDLFMTVSNAKNDWQFRNNGDGTFTQITSGPQVNDLAWSNSAGFADLDNDGDLDLLVTVGFSNAQFNNRLYYNNGDGTFVRDLTSSIVTDLGWSHGLALGDLDRDGDIDVALARNANENQTHALYLNDGNGNHWLDVRCIGGPSPRDGNGARISVKATISGTPRWQMRELTSPTGFGQNGLSAHFGLGNAMTLDTVEIRWPSGTTDYYFNVPADQFVVYTQCPDPDGDLVGCGDNCPLNYNPNQLDSNHDGHGDACCCVGTTGNVNGLGAVDLGDLSALVAYLTGGGYVITCLGEANVNGAGAIDLGDLSALVSYLTGGGYVLPTCP
jgi:hypothetical protein